MRPTRTCSRASSISIHPSRDVCGRRSKITCGRPQRLALQAMDVKRSNAPLPISGDPHVIAAQFATAWLARQTWKVGVNVILVISSVFVAMKARVTWYAAAQWGLSDDVRTVGKLVGLIDACAFWLSVIVGIVGCTYLVVRRVPSTALCAAHCGRLRHLLFLSAVSAAALSVSVMSDGVLTALRLVGREFSADFLIPISSMLIEIVCAGILIFSVRSIAVRMAHVDR